MRFAISVVAAVVLSLMVASGQAPAEGKALGDPGSRALQALDRYLETWNSRDPVRWAASLHFRTCARARAPSN